MLLPTQRTIRTDDLDVGEAQATKSLSRGVRKRRHTLDCVDPFCDTTQDRGRVARAPADLQDSLAASKAQSLNRERDDVRLCDRLALSDGQRGVLVSFLFPV